MLILKKPMTMQSLAALSVCPDRLGEKIRTNYRLLGTDLTCEDLLHMTMQPPDVYMNMEDNRTLVVENHINARNELKLELVNQTLNRLMLVNSTHFTYQDEVFVVSVLQKMGIVDVDEFVRQVRRHTEQNALLTGLIRQYFRYDTKRTHRTDDREAFAALKKKHKSDCYLHSGIFRRLMTAENDSILYRYGSQTAARAFSAESMRRAVWGQQADVIALTQYREQLFQMRSPAVWQEYMAYETKPLEKEELTEKRILRRMAAAILENMMQKLSYERLRGSHDNMIWKDYTRAFYQSAGDVLKRFQDFQGRKVPSVQRLDRYMRGMAELVQDELKLVGLLRVADDDSGFEMVMRSVFENQNLQRLLAGRMRIEEQFSNQMGLPNPHTGNGAANYDELRTDYLENGAANCDELKNGYLGNATEYHDELRSRCLEDGVENYDELRSRYLEDGVENYDGLKNNYLENGTENYNELRKHYLEDETENYDGLRNGYLEDEAGYYDELRNSYLGNVTENYDNLRKYYLEDEAEYFEELKEFRDVYRDFPQRSDNRLTDAQNAVERQFAYAPDRNPDTDGNIDIDRMTDTDAIMDIIFKQETVLPEKRYGQSVQSDRQMQTVWDAQSDRQMQTVWDAQGSHNVHLDESSPLNHAVSRVQDSPLGHAVPDVQDGSLSHAVSRAQDRPYDYMDEFLDRYEAFAANQNMPLMENAELLEQINRHNLYMKALLDSKDGVSGKNAKRVVVDRAKAKRDALRALEDPQAVLNEIYENAAAVKPEIPDEIERILSIADEHTRTFYERILGYRTEAAEERIEIGQQQLAEIFNRINDANVTNGWMDQKNDSRVSFDGDKDKEDRTAADLSAVELILGNIAAKYEKANETAAEQNAKENSIIEADINNEKSILADINIAKSDIANETIAKSSIPYETNTKSNITDGTIANITIANNHISERVLADDSIADKNLIRDNISESSITVHGKTTLRKDIWQNIIYSLLSEIRDSEYLIYQEMALEQNHASYESAQKVFAGVADEKMLSGAADEKMLADVADKIMYRRSAPDGRTMSDANIMLNRDTMSDRDALPARNAISDRDELPARNAVSDRDAVSHRDALPDRNVLPARNAASDKDAMSDRDTVPARNAISGRDAVSDRDVISDRDFLSDDVASVRTYAEQLERVTTRAVGSQMVFLPETPHISLVHKAEEVFSDEVMQYAADHAVSNSAEQQKIQGQKIQKQKIQKQIVQELVKQEQLKQEQITQRQLEDIRRELIAQSEEHIAQLVSRNLKTQMHTISDMVYTELERRLKNERRRRGY